jgi:SAM-dependent methyltransferase
VYATKSDDDVSWTQVVPVTSLELIRSSDIDPDQPIIDVGAGNSRLVDSLLEAGFTDLTVLDIAQNALERSKKRLGARADRVHWVVGDVTQFRAERSYALWHDRAVFHFLTDIEHRERYLGTVRDALDPGGTVVIGTFALDGPERCSGLLVQRYDPDDLARVFGAAFRLEESRLETHITPAGREQRFTFCRFTKR